MLASASMRCLQHRVHCNIYDGSSLFWICGLLDIFILSMINLHRLDICMPKFPVVAVTFELADWRVCNSDLIFFNIPRYQLGNC